MAVRAARQGPFVDGDLLVAGKLAEPLGAGLVESAERSPDLERPQGDGATGDVARLKEAVRVGAYVKGRPLSRAWVQAQGEEQGRHDDAGTHYWLLTSCF